MSTSEKKLLQALRCKLLESADGKHYISVPSINVFKKFRWLLLLQNIEHSDDTFHALIQTLVNTSRRKRREVCYVSRLPFFNLFQHCHSVIMFCHFRRESLLQPGEEYSLARGRLFSCCYNGNFFKQKCTQYPAIHINYSLSNCTISNKKDFNRSSDFLVIK